MQGYIHVLKLNCYIIVMSAKMSIKNLCKIMYYIYSTRYVLMVWQ